MHTALLINVFAHVLAATTYIALLVYVLHKGPTRLLNRLCALLMASFAVWSLGSVFSYASLTVDDALSWQNVSALGWCTFPVFALWFLLAFAGHGGLVARPLFLVLSSLPAIAFVYLEFTGYLIGDFIRQPYGWSTVWSSSPLTVAFAAYYVIFLSIGLFLAYRTGRRSKLSRTRRQAQWLVIPGIVSIVLASLNEVVLPLAGVTALPPLGDVCVLIWACSLAYAIDRYALMDISPSLAAPSIVQTMGDSLLLASMAGTVIAANPASRELLGYSEAELAGMELRELVAADADDAASTPLSVLAAERVNSHRAALLSKSGESIPVMLAASQVREDDEPLGVVVTAHDIRDHVAAERALRESEERYRTLVDNALVGIGLHQDLKMIFANREFHRMLGYAPGEIVGKPIADLIHPDYRDEIVRRAQRRQSGQDEPSTYEMPLLTRTGATLWAMISNALVEDGGRVATLICVADITESRMRRELEEANRELESFSSSLSQDLSAPLRSIEGFSEALLEDYADSLDETGKDYLRRIYAAGERMDQLLADMVRLSRLSGGEMRDELVDLSRLIHELADELQAREPSRQVRFVIADDVTVTGDPFLLRAAMDNLIGNAWKFSSKHPSATIEFGVTQQGGEPVYFVRDDGAGFDMRYVHKLFAPFQRLHSASEFTGTGMGLAAVERIIRRHGGRIWAESEVEHGATFFFTLAP